MMHLISPNHQNAPYINTPRSHVTYNPPKESSPRDFMKTHIRYLARYMKVNVVSNVYTNIQVSLIKSMWT